MSFMKSFTSHYRRNLYHVAARHRFRVRYAPGIATFHSGSKISNASYIREQPSSPALPPRSPFTSWVKWALGSLLTIVLPFWDHKWKNIARIEGEVEIAVGVVENAAEVVEKVALATEKMASNAAKSLPEDGKLKGAALFIEHISKEAAEDAHLAKDIIHKVDEVRHDVELLIEPIVHKGKIVDTDQGDHSK